MRATLVNTLSETVCRITSAQSVELGEVIQQLWSGYGVIQRAELRGLHIGNVVIKHIDITRARSNRRGWGGDLSHHRKVRSYQVEKAFYELYSDQCHQDCRVPKLIAAHEKDDGCGWVIVLEDLDDQGFSVRKNVVDPSDVFTCLTWLANFHATFMGNAAVDLWPVGTYWHLDTRPDELAAMPTGPLQRAAGLIDRRLNEAKYQTLLHGDAKVANFCFADRGGRDVAAVDFQYVGRGCGMKDVAYFISSCLSESEAAAEQDSLLAFYFRQLGEALNGRRLGVNFQELESEWRDLYPFAWADFCRFLLGWSPGHWKLNRYNDQITQSVLDQLCDSE